jgi:hypothetical protein
MPSTVSIRQESVTRPVQGQSSAQWYDKLYGGTGLDA